LIHAPVNVGGTEVAQGVTGNQRAVRRG